MFPSVATTFIRHHSQNQHSASFDSSVWTNSGSRLTTVCTVLCCSPSGWVDCDGVRLSRYVGDEAGAVGPLQLSHIDGVSQFGPVGRVVAEPMHAGVVRPVDVACDPVGRDVPRTSEVRALWLNMAAKKNNLYTVQYYVLNILVII